MYFRVAFLYLLSVCTNALVDDNLIVDYFVKKQIPSVVGYSCNSIEDHLILSKKFSAHGLRSALFPFNNASNIGKFRLSQDYLSSEYWKIGVLLDTRCYTTDFISSIFFDATNYRMFDNLYEWLVLGNNLTKVVNLINDKAFGFSTNFVIAVSSSTIPHGLENYTLYDVYNLYKDRGSLLNITYYGHWNSKIGLSISHLQPTFIRRANFRGLQLKALFYNSPYKPIHMSPTDYYQDYKSRGKDGRSKYGYSILTLLEDMFNFTLESLETKDWLPTDAFGPMTKSFQDFKVDLSGSTLIMTHHRLHYMKFLHPGFPFRTCFFFRNPQPTKIESDQIFRPFDTSVWRLIGLFTLTGSLILSILFSYDYNDSLRMNVSNSLVATIGAVCQQATDMEMERYSTRLGFFSILVFSLLIYNYYSACVVSARLDEPIFKINDSLIELGDLHLKMASENFNSFTIYLQLDSREHQVFANKYWAKVPESKKFLDPETGIQLVKKGGFAYNTHPEVGYDLIKELFDNREICELMEVHFGLPTITYFAVNNNCTFMEIIRVGLSKITDVGLRNRQVRKWLSSKPQCKKNVFTISSVTMYEFAAYLILLCSGFFISMLLCLIENVIIRWQTEFQKIIMI